MRFHITCGDRAGGTAWLEEVIGDIIDIPGMPVDSCAVHAMVNTGPYSPLYAVSHIESGQRVAAGDSIDFAIRLARERAASVDPVKRDAGLKKAIAFRRQLERNLAHQLPTAAPAAFFAAIPTQEQL